MLFNGTQIGRMRQIFSDFLFSIYSYKKSKSEKICLIR